MKRIVFLIIATLLVLGLVLPGCTESIVDERPIIKIAIVGPMDNIQGEHMLAGAELAATQINGSNPATDGVDVDGTLYKIDIIDVDTNEIVDPDGAEADVQAALSSDDPDFVIGGFRTEAVETYIDDIIEAEKIFFITGAATYSLLSGPSHYYDPPHAGTPYYPYETANTNYKYAFRGTPFNDIFLVNNCFMMFAMVAKKIQEEMEYIATPEYTPPYYVSWSDKVKVAILAESLEWADAMEASTLAIINGYGGFFGWELVGPAGPTKGLWEVGDQDSVEQVSVKLEQIKSYDAQVIFTILSGPVGISFGKAMGTVEDMNAIPVGINVESQQPSYWDATETSVGSGVYGAEYAITMGTWAPNVVQMPGITDDFLADWTAAEFPVYTAATYEVVNTLKAAIEAEDTFTDANDLIAWLEDVGNKQDLTTGVGGYYPQWDGATKGAWKSGASPVWPALNATQLAEIYTAGWYLPIGVSNYTMPPFTTHDLIYGVRSNDADVHSGWVTGIAVQWQTDPEDSDAGIQVGIWPKAGYDVVIPGYAGLKLMTTLSQAVTGLNWSNTAEYEGTEPFEIPQDFIDAWGG